MTTIGIIGTGHVGSVRVVMLTGRHPPGKLALVTDS
jgi:hypothetical protein